MKVHFEATLHEYHEGVVELEPDEVEKYQALPDAEAQQSWVRSFVHEVIYDGDHQVHREVDDGAFWYVEDGDGERHMPGAVRESS